jgi:hypothetical protein
VDAVELLLGDAPFIADTSAWWRFSSLPAELAGLVMQAISSLTVRGGTSFLGFGVILRRDRGTERSLRERIVPPMSCVRR